MPREKSRYRDKRSSSCGSDTSYDRKKSKSKHKRRSRSRDRSESSSHKRRRSASRSKYRRRSHSRSVSRDRYVKSRRGSTSRTRSRRNKRSDSRDRSHSRSSSRSRSKHSKSNKKSKRSRSSSSRSSSFDIERPLSQKCNLDDTETKLEKAIKAAEAAGLTMTKIPTYEYKEVDIKEDMPTIHDRNMIEELNSDSFVQKPFTSSRNKRHQNIVIDLNAQTVKVPEAEVKVEEEDSIIKLDELPSEEDLREMWIKKLYQLRKKMLKGEL